ncbi:MAG TPA: ATP-binding protein, partial [Candidatus Dormibacteraeota bacterium]|nr:ATP-binding protein [Candidatus Dormibacteraeota bacterium]
RAESDAVLVSQADQVASTIDETRGMTFDPSDLPLEASGGVSVSAAMVTPTGGIDQTQGQPLSTVTLSGLAHQVWAGGKPQWSDVTAGGVARRVYARPLSVGPEPRAVLIVSRSISAVQASILKTAVLLALISLAVVAMGALAALWLVGSVLKPVRTIAGLARSISERELNKRVEIEVPKDELGELVNTFNSMLGRLDSAFDSLRRFTADASHELRAPLTLMRTELEGALQQNRTPAEYRDSLTTVHTEVEHLGRLVDQLLVLARADAGALNPALEPVDVADFVHETAARWEATAAARQVRIDVQAPDSGVMEVDPSLLRRLFDNLIDNGVRHSPPGGTVSLSAIPDRENWVFDVTDRGLGVPLQYQDQLFSRFSRPDTARARRQGGAGLGLAMSASIASAHGGLLALVPTATGATFRLRIPGRPRCGAPKAT